MVIINTDVSTIREVTHYRVKVVAIVAKGRWLLNQDTHLHYTGHSLLKSITVWVHLHSQLRHYTVVVQHRPGKFASANTENHLPVYMLTMTILPTTCWLAVPVVAYCYPKHAALHVYTHTPHTHTHLPLDAFYWIKHLQLLYNDSCKFIAQFQMTTS